MIATSAGQTVPFTPAWYREVDTPPVFLLRAGSVIERGQMEAELAGPHRAGKVFGFELRAAVRKGVLALLAGDPDLERVLGLIDAEGQGDATKLSAEDDRLLTYVRGVLAEHWPEYRDLVAQLERRRAIAPIVALRRYCIGWTDVKSDAGEHVAFGRGLDGFVTEAALAPLSDLDLSAAGSRAYELQYGRGQEGNSARPSTSDDGQQSSSSDVSSKAAAGKSKASGGRKTPGSRSRRGSGRS